MFLLRRLLVRPLPVRRRRLGRLLPPPLVGPLLPPAPGLLPHRRHRRQVGIAGGGDGRAGLDRRLVVPAGGRGNGGGGSRRHDDEKDIANFLSLNSSL